MTWIELEKAFKDKGIKTSVLLELKDDVCDETGQWPAKEDEIPLDILEQAESEMR